MIPLTYRCKQLIYSVLVLCAWNILLQAPSNFHKIFTIASAESARGNATFLGDVSVTLSMYVSKLCTHTLNFALRCMQIFFFIFIQNGIRVCMKYSYRNTILVCVYMFFHKKQLPFEISNIAFSFRCDVCTGSCA